MSEQRNEQGGEQKNYPNMQFLTVEGRLGQDAIFKVLPSGKTVCNFSIASNDKKGTTIWWSCSQWNASEGLASALRAGRSVKVVGDVWFETYEAKDGSGPKEAKKLDVTNLYLGFLPNNERGESGAKPVYKASYEEVDSTDIPF